MIIQPQAHNSITIILDNGDQFELHDCDTDNKSYLNISTKRNIKVETMNVKDASWDARINEYGTIRLSSVERMK